MICMLSAEAALGWLNTHGPIPDKYGTHPMGRIPSAHKIEQACTDRSVFIAHVKLHLQGDGSPITRRA